MRYDTITIQGRRYVVIPEEEYLRQEECLRQQDQADAPETDDEAEQDRRGVVESQRRLNDPVEKPIPWEQAKREGL